MSWTDGAESASRDFVVDGEGNVCRDTGYMTDCLSEDSDKVPLQTHTLREFEQHLNDLKKENFSLKLRIYFLEERIQQKFEDSGDDIYRTNIELKVEVESLKQELQEKQQLLDKALTTAESLTNHNEVELQRRCEERQQEIDHMQRVLESRIQILQEEAQFARDEAERMASLAESHFQHPSVAMETLPKETSGDVSPDEDADRHRIEQLSAALCCKEHLIRELTEERTELRQRVKQMEEQLQQLAVSLLERERDAQVCLTHHCMLGRVRGHGLVHTVSHRLSTLPSSRGHALMQWLFTNHNRKKSRRRDSPHTNPTQEFARSLYAEFPFICVTRSTGAAESTFCLFSLFHKAQCVYIECTQIKIDPLQFRSMSYSYLCDHKCGVF